MSTGDAIQIAFRHRLGSFEFDMDLEMPAGLNVLFGPSGSGKTQTLRVVAGLLRPESGRVEAGGTLVFDSTAKIDLPARQRPVGFVPQQLALFPHMSVAENIRFGMAAAGGREARIDELLLLLGMGEFRDRRPSSLSGGQQQRVALARALARDARVLLLDEPFSALDEGLRAGLRDELLRLRRELGLTVLFVTHDLREAHLLAETMAVLDEGRVLQSGNRDDIFKRPSSRRVAELTGVENLLPARIMSTSNGAASADVGGLTLRCASVAAGTDTSSEAFMGIRAERVNLRRPLPELLQNHLIGRVVEEWAYGNTHSIRFQPVGPGPELIVELASRPYEVLGVAGQREWLLELPPEDLHLMPG